MKCWSALGLCVLVWGCTSEEPFYNSAPTAWRFLVLTDAPALQLREEPGSKLLHADLYVEANGTPMGDPPSTAVFFRNALYLLLQTAALEVLDTASYRRRARIALPAPAAGIVFPNATTGYLWHPTTQQLSVLDLLVPTLARSIPLEGSPRWAVAAEGQLFVLDEANSRLLVFDTRSLRVVDSLPLPPRPCTAVLRSHGSELLVLSTGSGDDTTASAPRAPRLSFVELEPLRLLASIPVFPSAADSAHVRVTGLVATPEDFAYVGTSAGLLRVDIRTRGSVRLLQRWAVQQLSAVPVRGELWIVSAETPPRLIIATGTRAEVLLSAPLPEGTRAVVPIP
ncbi:hypothetical protein HRbin21_00561 [bacterium HR21]|nr:hypothetical protein HRbin21_00561 [bacterium HR21]